MIKRIFAFLLSLLLHVQFGFIGENKNTRISFLTDALAVTQKECSETPGKVWDNRLNDCVTSAQQAKIQDRVKNMCKDMSGEEYQNCYYNAALQAMDEENVRGTEDVNQFVGAGLSSGIATIATFMTAKHLIDRSKKGITCKATSMWMMAGAGAAVVVGEVVANVTYRNKLKEEIKDYEKKVQPASSSEELTDQELVEKSTVNQLQAFQFLINQEGHRKNMMKTRKNIYTGVMALYGGAVVVSVIEGLNVQNQAQYICEPSTKSASDGAVPETGSYNFKLQKAKENVNLFVQLIEDLKVGRTGKILSYMAQIVSIDSAQAQEYTKKFKKYANEQDVAKEFGRMLTGIGIGAGAVGGVAIFAKNFTNKALETIFKTPFGRGSYSTLLGSYAYAVMEEAKKHEKISEERQKAIQEVYNDLAGNPPKVAGCTSADRDDSSKPGCYCYIHGSQKNLKRQNQEVCKKQWGEVPRITAQDFNYRGGNGPGGPSTCVNSAYKVDEACSCKKSNKKDSCLSVKTPSGFNGIGAVPLGNAATDALNSLLGGNYGSGEVLDGVGNNLAMMNKKAKAQLAKNKKAAAALKKMQNNAKKIKNAYARKYGPRLAASGFKSPFAAAPLANFDPKKVAEEVEKEIAKAAEYEEASKKAATMTEGDGFDLDFSTAGATGTTIEDVSDVMDKEFDYGDNDINNRPQDSIFKILTMRYQTSGLRRLFDDKNQFEAEEANNSDIHGQE